MPRYVTGNDLINSTTIPFQNSYVGNNEFYYPSTTAVSILTQLQYLRYSGTAEPLELAPVDSGGSLCPLDLSLKGQQNPPITPPTTPSPKHLDRKRKRSESPENLSNKWIQSPVRKSQTPVSNSEIPTVATNVLLPTKKIKTSGTVIPAHQNNINSTPTKKSKAVRKLNFDEDKSSPVSGTIIRELGPDETLVVRKGDIDPAYNLVEVTEEAKAELAKIENHIGDYVCRLCKELYDDAFQLAQHRCSRIVHVEYRCPECDKVFNCPANLASHRRWHKPRAVSTNNNDVSKDTHTSSTPTVSDDGVQFPCVECGKKFRRQAYLRKHLTTHANGYLDGQHHSAEHGQELEVN